MPDMKSLQDRLRQNIQSQGRRPPGVGDDVQPAPVVPEQPEPVQTGSTASSERTIPQAPEPTYRASTEMDMQYGGSGGSSGGSGDISDDNNTADDFVPPERPAAVTQPAVDPVKRDKPANDHSTPKKAKTEVHPKRETSEFIQVAKFPRKLMALIRAEFPDAVSNNDALAAYVYVKTGRSCEVPDNIKILADSYDGDKSAETISKTLQNLNKQMLAQMALSQETMFGVSYLILNALGFRQDNPPNARQADLMESEMADMINRLRTQAREYRQQESIKNGRPIR